MAFTKFSALTIGEGAPSGDTIHGAITKIDANCDNIVIDLNSLDKRSPEYNTIWVPASDMTPRTTNGAAAGTYEYVTNDVMMVYYAFDDATQEYADFSIVMPENWDRGTVKAKFYWSSATGSTAGDLVAWGIAGMALADSDALDTAFSVTADADDVLLADNGADLQISPATGALTIAGSPALGELIKYVVTRRVLGNDNMTEDAWLFGVNIQYRMANTVSAW